MILLVTGVIGYAIFEGVTEAMTWNFRDQTDNVTPGEYHLARVGEMFSLAVIALAIQTMALPTIGFIMAFIASIMLFYLPYQAGFKLYRKYIDGHSKNPDWEVGFPFFKIRIPHPTVIIQVALFIAAVLILITTRAIYL